MTLDSLDILGDINRNGNNGRPRSIDRKLAGQRQPIHNPLSYGPFMLEQSGMLLALTAILKSWISLNLNGSDPALGDCSWTDLATLILGDINKDKNNKRKRDHGR